MNPNISTFGLPELATLIAAAGALGVAAFGAVESIGKTLFVFDTPWFGGSKRSWGLPYVGFGIIRRLVRPLSPALKIAYGDQYDAILRQQYRDGRSTGQAPDTIRQGVRLGLPFLSVSKAAEVISATWGMEHERATELARALTREKASAAGDGATASKSEVAKYQALAGRFSTALDLRVGAAFALAEQVYQSRARTWAGGVAVALSLGYHFAAIKGHPSPPADQISGWALALIVGLVAVPLAPAAKDLSSSISDAVSALSKIQSGKA